MTTRLPPPQLLCQAYAEGYFPMPEPDTEEILWYRPDPRAILPLNGFHCSKSFQKFLKKTSFTTSFDKAFLEVMDGCADRSTTWINNEFKRAYFELHQMGIGHSVEIWDNTTLVGGSYGLALGGAFFAESMFHRKTGASKMALFKLVEHLRTQGFQLLEVQFLTPHLESLGAIEIPSREYEGLLRKALSLRVGF